MTELPPAPAVIVTVLHCMMYKFFSSLAKMLSSEKTNLMCWNAEWQLGDVVISILQSATKRLPKL